jgi:hypothetical protein
VAVTKLPEWIVEEKARMEAMKNHGENTEASKDGDDENDSEHTSECKCIDAGQENNVDDY